jgi:uncharacterized LabA/DUF88 family protein
MPPRKLDKQEVPVQIHYTAQRIGVLIDVQNMYYSAKNLFGAKVNFINVVKGAIRDRNLIRAIAYVVETPQQHEVRFLDALRLQGIELKERDLQVFSSGVKKADWDVGITVDAIRMSDKCDVIVLVSGDGDYIPLVEYLQHKGCKVEVMAFRNTSSSRLVEAADQFIDLAEDGQYMIQTGGGQQRGHQRQHTEEPESEISSELEAHQPTTAAMHTSTHPHTGDHQPHAHNIAHSEEDKKNQRRNKRTIM